MSDDEKPLASWPCPPSLKPKYEQTSQMQLELSKLIDKVKTQKAKFEAACNEMWQETKESLANTYPDQAKKIYGAVGLHYNEDTEEIESWTIGKGPFKETEGGMPRIPPLVLNMGPGNQESGGKVVDKTKDILGDVLGRGRDLDLGLDDTKDKDDDDDDGTVNPGIN